MTEIIDSTFTENTAYEGGALFTDGTAEVVVRDSHFTGNKAVATVSNGGSHGGAVLLMATGRPCVVSNCTFEANEACRADESYGGAICSEGPSSGAIRLVVLDSTFGDNLATTSGGAIAADYNVSSLYGFVCAVTNCTFRRNHARQGGALGMASGSFAGCTFESNLATNRVAGGAQTSCYGGAFYPTARGTITAPEATNGLVFAGCTFKGNRTYGQCGSAVYLARAHGTYVKPDASLTDCTFADNFVVQANGGWSGAVSVDSSIANFTVDRCRFERNFSPGCGAALAIKPEDGTISTIRNSLFLANSNTYYWAGAATAWKNTRIENCSFVKNRCNQESTGNAGNGAAIWLRSSTGSAIVNCLFYDNRATKWSAATQTKNDVIVEDGATDVISHSCSNWDYHFPTTEGLHNFQCADPKFVDAASDDYRLAHGSPCVNRGLNAAWMIGAKDLQNSKKVDRIINEVVDVGCYEYRPAPGLLMLLR